MAEAEIGGAAVEPEKESEVQLILKKAGVLPDLAKLFSEEGYESLDDVRECFRDEKAIDRFLRRWIPGKDVAVTQENWETHPKTGKIRKALVGIITLGTWCTSGALLL